MKEKTLEELATMSQEEVERYFAQLKADGKDAEILGEPIECESKLNADFAKP
ncbi:MAG: hypothetical protein LIP09_04850 [Bacteroidales bacterium]|nr:hypothetical protein [Bacteroidales bacterium]